MPSPTCILFKLCCQRFKGIREGGVGENASYYVFTHAADGGIEAYPLNEWYNFHNIPRYKHLSAEEAEQEFGRRNKVMNYFSLMLRKRLKNEEDGEGEDGEEAKPKKGKKSTDFKISEMDDWVDSDEDESSDEEKEEGEKTEKKKDKKKKAPGKEKAKKKRGSDESAFEESDDGDEEGRELDYISDSSESESDTEGKAVKDLKGVAEEKALRKLLTSDEDDEEDEEGEKNKDENGKGDGKEGGKDGDKTDGKEGGKDGAGKDSKKRKRKKKATDKKKTGDDSSSASSGDSTDSEADKANKEAGGNGPSTSRSATPTDKGKKGENSGPAKKPRMDVQAPLLSYGGESGVTEEAVRRYLMRKPMTATELVQKFKVRKTGLSSDQLVNVMTQILKKINPAKQTIKDKMYLSIKPQ